LYAGIRNICSCAERHPRNRINTRRRERITMALEYGVWLPDLNESGKEGVMSTATSRITTKASVTSVVVPM
jgi:hypothetical protein